MSHFWTEKLLIELESLYSMAVFTFSSIQDTFLLVPASKTTAGIVYVVVPFFAKVMVALSRSESLENVEIVCFTECQCWCQDKSNGQAQDFLGGGGQDHYQDANWGGGY